MKTYLLLLALFVSPQTYAQTNIDGIGCFRIHQSLKSITSQLDSEAVEYVDLSTLSKSDQLMHSAFIYDKSTITLWVRQYTLYGIKLRDLKLYFYNDSLFQIHTKGDLTELSTAITLKYGQPTTKREEIPVSCTYTYTGAKTSHTGYETTTTWRNDNIHCYNYISKYYSDDCKERFLYYFLITDTSTSEIVRQLALKSYKQIREKEDEDKRLKYKDFR